MLRTGIEGLHAGIARHKTYIDAHFINREHVFLNFRWPLDFHAKSLVRANQLSHTLLGFRRRLIDDDGAGFIRIGQRPIRGIFVGIEQLRDEVLVLFYPRRVRSNAEIRNGRATR